MKRESAKPITLKSLLIKWSPGCAPLICLLLACLYVGLAFWWEEDPLRLLEQRITQWQREADVPAVTHYYDAIWARIADIAADDVLLESELVPPYTAGGAYTGCIRSNGQQTYGTSRPFSEVVAEYDMVFHQGMGWGMLARNLKLVVYDWSGSTSLLLSHQIFFETHDPPEWREYQTVYRVLFLFADPAIGDCYG